MDATDRTTTDATEGTTVVDTLPRPQEQPGTAIVGAGGGPAPGHAPTAHGHAPTLQDLRTRIDQVDRELLAALARRAELARAVSRMKRLGGIPAVDPAREAVIVRTAVGRARELRIPDEEVRDLAWRTLALCRRAQEGGMDGALP